jgi:hypothetical protein
MEHTVLLHDSKELDDDLGGRTDEDLALAGLLGVVHGVERIVEDGSLDHFGGLGIEILKSFGEKKIMRYLYDKTQQKSTPSRLSGTKGVFKLHNKSATTSLERKECPFCIARSSSARAELGDAYHLGFLDRSS